MCNTFTQGPLSSAKKEHNTAALSCPNIIIDDATYFFLIPHCGLSDWLGFLCTVVFLVLVNQYHEVRVLVNRNNPTNIISADLLSKLYLCLEVNTVFPNEFSGFRLISWNLRVAKDFGCGFIGNHIFLYWLLPCFFASQILQGALLTIALQWRENFVAWS